MPRAESPASQVLSGGPRRAWNGLQALVLLATVGAGLAGRAAAAPSEPSPASGAEHPGMLLERIRPDYLRFIGALRRFEPAGHDPALAHGRGPRQIYMALVRPGASDPELRDSAPLIGSEVRNEVVYDPSSIGGRSTAWALLLLDHEYFHARHLAGATSLPLPGRVPAEVERHYYEAAAWGFNVAEARAGRYAGLRPDEFREALDHYGEHYRALRDLLKESRSERWSAFLDLLRRPPALITVRTAAARAAGVLTQPSAAPVTAPGRPPLEVPGRPSASDRSPAIP